MQVPWLPVPRASLVAAAMAACRPVSCSESSLRSGALLLPIGAGPASPSGSAPASPGGSREVPAEGGSRLAKYLENSRKVAPSGCTRGHAAHTVTRLRVCHASSTPGNRLSNRRPVEHVPVVKVLRFFCVWDDRVSLLGDRRPYRLHYFLEDDTVEVLEVQCAYRQQLTQKPLLYVVSVDKTHSYLKHHCIGSAGTRGQLWTRRLPSVPATRQATQGQPWRLHHHKGIPFLMY